MNVRELIGELIERDDGKVIITSRPSHDLDGYYIGEAATEEGVVIGWHASSSLAWSRVDMTNPFKIAQYGEYFPNGFEIVFNGEAIGKALPKKDTKKSENNTKPSK